MKRIGFLLLVIALMVGLVACGQKQSTTDVKTITNEPVALKVLLNNTGISDTEFDRYFVSPVKAKYPNISLELVRSGDQGNSPDQLLAAGTFPDLILTGYNNVFQLLKLQVVQDLSSLIKSNSYDLKRLDPVLLQGVKDFGKNGEMIGIPYSQNFPALVYNRDLFDKFAVPYPKDLMNWQDVLELSKKLTREEGGIQYRGFDPYDIVLFGKGLSLPYIDAKTGKASINNDSWKRIFQLAKDFYDIPGFVGPNNNITFKMPGFFKDKKMAMIPMWVDQLISQLDNLGKNSDLNWDLVSIPNFKEAIGTGREIVFPTIMISTVTKHPNEAFKVIEALTSDEVQLDMTKNGKMGALTNLEPAKNFALSSDNFKGKNMKGIFKAKNRVPHPPQENDQYGMQALRQSVSVLVKGTDVNTLLREAEDKANQAIESAK